MIDWLLEPFALGYMQRSLAAVLIAGLVCAWVGVHVTLRKMSFFGDGIAHSTLPGVVLAYVAGWHILIGALTSASAAVIGVAWSARHEKVEEDSTIGVMMTGAFALGIAGMHRVASKQDLTHILVGNILGVTESELAIIGYCAIAVVITLIFAHRLLCVTMLDARHARTINFSPDLARSIVLATAALAIVTTLSMVGLVLAVALLITPAATARLVCSRIATTIAMAISISMLAGIGGIYASWYGDWPTGASIVILLTSTFLLTRFGVTVAHWLRRPSAPAAG